MALNTIYVLVRNVYSDGYDSRGYWSEEIEPEFGFFTDKATAEEEAERLNQPIRERFEAANERIAAQHRAAIRAFDLWHKQNEALKAADLPGLGNPPRKPADKPALKKWKSYGYEEESYYTVDSIDRHGEKAE